ncbi:MAG: guanylate kinase [Gallionellaceae bacterium]|nr:guanylate kinase [Gallionellaceae bacterium]
MPGNLFIVSAPSGAGKSSLVKALLEADPGIKLSISYTTRAPRPGEVDGVHYHFVGVDAFRDMLNHGDFLESAEVYGNYYGSSQPWIEDQMRAGHDLLLEIDWQGAAQVRKLFPDAVGLFILPPSLAELKRRLEGRGQDSAEVIARRVEAAQEDISHAYSFDYLLVNDDFATALADFHTIVQAQRLHIRNQMSHLEPLLSELLGTPS